MYGRMNGQTNERTDGQTDGTDNFNDLLTSAGSKITIDDKTAFIKK